MNTELASAAPAANAEALEKLTAQSRTREEVASEAWNRHARAPRYPKSLTANELVAQVMTTMSDDRTDVIAGVTVAGEKAVSREVARGVGLLMRLTQLDSEKIFPILGQFETFILNVASPVGTTPWPSWKHAWRDFANHIGLNTTNHNVAMIKEGIPA